MRQKLRSTTAILLGLLGWAVANGVVLPPRAASAAEGFLCSAGSNDNLECDFDSDCPGGACLAGQNICNGGTEDGGVCDTSADCGGGTCVLTARVCLGGDNRGFACVRDAHCPDSTCIVNGLFCFGGGFDRFACVINADCIPDQGDPGTCRGPATPLPVETLCSAGARDGLTCELDEDCPNGACVVAQTVCDGGDLDGQFCDADTDCSPGNPCTQTQRICSAGNELKGTGCLRSTHCDGGTCVSSGRVCFGGDFDFFSCIDDTDCGTDQTGSCEAPGGVEPTPTFTRRPTPAPTATRTLPPGVPTSTRTATPTKEPDTSDCVFVDNICVKRKREGSCSVAGGGNGSLAALGGIYLWLRTRRRRPARR